MPEPYNRHGDITLKRHIMNLSLYFKDAYNKDAVLRVLTAALLEDAKKLQEELKKIVAPMRSKIFGKGGNVDVPPPEKGSDFYIHAAEMVHNSAPSDYPMLKQNWLNEGVIDGIVRMYMEFNKGTNIHEAVQEVQKKDVFMDMLQKSVLIRANMPFKVPGIVHEINFDKLKPSNSVVELTKNINGSITAYKIWQGLKDNYKFMFEGISNTKMLTPEEKSNIVSRGTPGEPPEGIPGKRMLTPEEKADIMSKEAYYNAPMKAKVALMYLKSLQGI